MFQGAVLYSNIPINRDPLHLKLEGQLTPVGRKGVVVTIIPMDPSILKG
ncbi:hypothetical protein hamaS1_05930 [Moorella sp. Hama-1]|nr:hypothetical protein hamaS1_05930 [Moorella sp. Hama-1]